MILNEYKGITATVEYIHDEKYYHGVLNVNDLVDFIVYDYDKIYNEFYLAVDEYIQFITTKE